MILSDIEAKLREIDPSVYYGMVDESRKETLWNYIVFNRRENYVPEGIDAEVIEKLTSLPGVRLAGTDCTFNYVQKPNTNIIVEMLSIPFVRARK